MKFLTRREFSKLTLAAIAGASAAPCIAASPKPNSKVRGVQLGLNVPYSFSDPAMSGEDILKNCVQLGVSAVELRTQPVEVFLGGPKEIIFAKSGRSSAQTEELANWRKSVHISRAAKFRKMFEHAGVLIQIVKVDGIFKMTDGELDYAFALAKALGGRAISTEISRKEAELKRVGQFADKHRQMVGYHGHAETKPEHWELAFSLAKFNGANVDLGHFVAGNNTSPAPFIEKYHERVTHIHLKDRKKNKGPNMPFGEGDTPIGDVLRLIRDNKWPIQGTVEFEYQIPAGSDRMTEIARALKYCKDALMA
jgi:sugar phosphate isomerase/epimerase